MILQKKHIETILKINGVSSNSPDEEIRSVLLSARYDDDEINTAIMVLRENLKTKETTVDGLHKVFRTHNSLKSHEISSLLGIDVEINELPIHSVKTNENEFKHSLIFVIIAVTIAAIGVFTAMYWYKVGVFYPSDTFLTSI